MPDIDFQKIELNLIPKKGDEPVIFYASQYESARPFIADLKWGTTEFAPGDDCYAEIDIRKNDNNLVVITDDVAIDNNEVSVILPVQALTCIGKNLGQVKIYAADDQLIAALNFILEVQPDPLAGGVDSASAIDNLTSQIAAIVPVVIGEDYYDKTEVDNLLADKADVSDLPDMTQYYTKTQTDTLLNGKADASTTYTKTEVDNALALKANSSDLATVATTGDYDDLLNKPTIPAAQIQSDYAQADNTQVDYIKNKPDIAGMIAAAIFNILPVGTATGNPCSFDTEIAAPLQGLTANIVASGGGGTPSTPIPIVGISSLDITRCGKNLCEESYTNGATSAYYDVAFCKAPLLPNTTYTFSFDDVSGNKYYTNENVFTSQQYITVSSNRVVITATTKSDLQKASNTYDDAHGWKLFKNTVSQANTPLFNNFSVELGTTSGEYAPYNGQTFTIDLGGTRYGGVYDKSGRLTITHVKDSITKDWQNIGQVGGVGNFQAQILMTSTPKDFGYSEVAPSNTANILTAKSRSDLNNSVEGFATSGNYIRVYVNDVSVTDVTSFRNWLENNPLDVVYELATPIEIDVSAISVEAVSGVNNIISNGNGDVTAQYKDSIQHYIDNQ